MACGVPIVGYANKMLKELVTDSKAALCARVGDNKRLAGIITDLWNDKKRLSNMCRNARLFASQHLFNNEFDKRTSQISKVLSE